MLAAIRPDDVNFPLFLHVFGAMLLVGTLFAVALATVLAWRRPDDAVGLTRFSLRTLLMGVLPAYILMRVGAQWTESNENFPDDFEPAWLGHRLHHRGRRRAAGSHLAHSRGVGPPEAAERIRRCRFRPGCRGDLHPAARRLHRRRLGDDREADLARSRTPTWASLSGLSTDRTATTTPSAISNAATQRRRPRRR